MGSYVWRDDQKSYTNIPDLTLSRRQSPDRWFGGRPKWVKGVSCLVMGGN